MKSKSDKIDRVLWKKITGQYPTCFGKYYDLRRNVCRTPYTCKITHLCFKSWKDLCERRFRWILRVVKERKKNEET